MARRRPSLKLPEHYGPRAYARLFRRLVVDSLWRHKRTVVLMMVAGLGGLALQAAAMGLVIGYARQLQQDATMSFLGREFVAQESLELLVVAALVGGGLLMASAFLDYRSSRMALRLRLDYMTFCTTRGFGVLGVNERLRFEHVTLSEDEKALGRIVKKDAKYCGRVMGILANLIMPVVTVMVAAAVLLYLAPLATLVLIALLVASMPWLYRINQQSAQASRDHEDVGRPAGREYRHVMRWLSRSPFQLRDPDALSESFRSLDTIQAQDDVMWRRLVSIQKAQLVSGIAAASALLVLVIGIGGVALRAGAGFTHLFAYLLILGRALASFRTINRHLSRLNRFQPQVKRYFALIDEASEVRSEPPPLPDRVSIHVRPDAADTALDHLEVEAPVRIALVAPMVVTRYSLPTLVRALVWKEPDEAEAVAHAAAFVTSSYEYLPGRPLRESLGVDEDVDLDALRSDLRRLGVEPTGSADPIPLLDEDATEDVWGRFGQDLKFAFAVLAVERAGAEWVFVDEKSLKKLGKGSRETMLEALRGRCRFVVHGPQGPRVGAYGEELVVAVDRESVLGIGDVEWFRAHPSISAAVASAAGISVEIAAGIEDDEDEDDEDDDLGV